MRDIEEINERRFLALDARLAALYGKAIQRILKRNKAFLARIRAIAEGKEKPPAHYDDAQKRRWVETRVQMAVEEEGVEASIGNEIAAAGIAASALIVADMIARYRDNRRWVQNLIEQQIKAARAPTPHFPTLTERQIQIIYEDAQPPGAKIAFLNLGSSPTFIRRFQREMATVTRRGEDQRQLVRRITQAMQDTSKAAKKRAELIAQTERTRVQSQARWEMEDEAERQGIRMADEWLCQMIPPHKTASGWSSGSRDSHIALHRQVRLHGQPWVTIHGHTLRYPGDPSAPPSEVCRCHCALRPHVLLSGEDVVDGKIERRRSE